MTVYMVYVPGIPGLTILYNGTDKSEAGKTAYDYCIAKGLAFDDVWMSEWFDGKPVCHKRYSLSW